MFRFALKNYKASAAPLSFGDPLNPPKLLSLSGNRHLIARSVLHARKGTMVLLVEDFSSKESLVLKLCDASYPRLILCNEFKNLQRLKHVPGVQQVLAFDRLGSCGSLLAKPFGKPLDMFIQKMDPNHMTIIMLKLLQTLQYVHKLDVYHCDIKPSNIIITEEGPVLIDFGLACTSNELITNFIGTLHFASIPSMQCEPITPYHDYESLLYTTIYVINGKLPWSNIQDFETVLQMKKKFVNNTLLCKGLPPLFITFADYVLCIHHTRQKGVKRLLSEAKQNLSPSKIVKAR